jgi:hypothetical protein
MRMRSFVQPQVGSLNPYLGDWLSREIYSITTMASSCVRADRDMSRPQRRIAGRPGTRRPRMV